MEKTIYNIKLGKARVAHVNNGITDIIFNLDNIKCLSDTQRTIWSSFFAEILKKEYRGKSYYFNISFLLPLVIFWENTTIGDVKKYQRDILKKIAKRTNCQLNKNIKVAGRERFERELRMKKESKVKRKEIKKMNIELNK